MLLCLLLLLCLQERNVIHSYAREAILLILQPDPSGRCHLPITQQPEGLIKCSINYVKYGLWATYPNGMEGGWPTVEELRAILGQ
jgi:hypothetical protein